jgi:hypothetical protein
MEGELTAADVTGFPSFAPRYRPRSPSLLARLGARVISMRLAQARHRQRFHLAELAEPALMPRHQTAAEAEKQA